jgi:serine phosphatase RsbU (regulator of sigma subunit)
MGLGLTSRLLFERALRLERIQLAPGDAFILYSDGITEAMNEGREQFGEERLQAVVDSCDGQDARSTEQAILQAVREFIGSAPPHDDMTLFVVRV